MLFSVNLGYACIFSFKCVCVCRGEYALAEYTEVKAITIRLGEQLKL